MSNYFADPNEPATVPIHILDPDALTQYLAAATPETCAWIETMGFSGKLGQQCLVPDPSGGLAEVLFGWGDETRRARGRFHLATLPGALPTGSYRLETLLGDPAEHVLGWILAQYRFDRYKSASDTQPRQLVPPQGIHPARLETIAASAGLTMDLINTPANDMGPDALEAAFRQLASAHGSNVSVTAGDDLLAANFPMIHTVGRAAVQAPRLLDLTHGPADAPKVTLVGKGVCFDTGGLNLKPGNSMGLMKKDMGGAATSMGLARMILSLDLPIRLRLLIPAVENSVSAGAFRPGDVLTARNGKTVEINNTDAEGRLVLADALALAAEETPDMVISMATLTGAARVAVGPDLAPYYTTDDAFAPLLETAARDVADPVWRMPFHDPYEGMIEPAIADLDNAPSGGFAGSITAALFLRRFVGDVASYTHFDIYGWTPAARPARPKGGVMQAARAVLAALEARYA